MTANAPDVTVDVHTHVVPPGLPFIDGRVERDPRWASLQVDPSGRTADVIVAGRVFRRIRRVAFDLDARREEAELAGRAGQLLSAMPELFAAWAPVDDATDYCRAFNEWLAGEIAGRRDFFHGLGIVPMQDPHRAAGALRAVAELGLLGVEVPSRLPERALHDPAFAEFFGEAEQLGLLVFVHSVGDVSDFPHPMAGTSAVFPARIGEAIAGLIAAGVLTRHPDLQVMASHGAGGLPASLARLDFVRDMAPETCEFMPEPSVTYARRIWFDTLLFDSELIALLSRTVGTGRLVFGTDYPFLTGDVESLLRDPRLPEGFAAAVCKANPRRLLDSLDRSRQAPGGMS